MSGSLLGLGLTCILQHCFSGCQMTPVKISLSIGSRIKKCRLLTHGALTVGLVFGFWTDFLAMILNLDIISTVPLSWSMGNIKFPVQPINLASTESMYLSS